MTRTLRERNSTLVLASSRTDHRNAVSQEPSSIETRRAHQQNARDAAIHGSVTDRVNFLINDVFVHTKDFSRAIKTIEELIERAREIHIPSGWRIVAGGGMGKNTLLRFFRRKYPSEEIGETFRCPVIGVDINAHLKPTHIVQQLLTQLRSVYRQYQELPHLEDNLRAAIESAGTIVIFFNEAQHLLRVSKIRDRTAARLAGLTGDWFKRFLDSIPIPVILMGVTGWDEIFDYDDQLRTRIPNRFEFSPLDPDKHFVAVLSELDKAIPMPVPAGLTDKKIANGLFEVTKGNWRLLIRLFADAIRYATNRGSPRIELCDLSAAHAINFGPAGNPFDP